MRRRRYTDRGSATVWSVGAIGVLCAVFGVLLGLGQAVVVRHRAAGAADLAALAAADHWAEGTAAACARADRVARAQGARLARCVIVGDVSDVTTASGGGPFAAEVRARAGPAASARDAPAPARDAPAPARDAPAPARPAAAPAHGGPGSGGGPSREPPSAAR
ncbi:flp pilus-assembly TadE/G-like family protein [Streptomyces gramineus]|uniref:Rv3654c family TadE-like protein n=1 Tax=Streptomyces gramineus TaxID=910542 RepID=UPI00398B9498